MILVSTVFKICLVSFIGFDSSIEFDVLHYLDIEISFHKYSLNCSSNQHDTNIVTYDMLFYYLLTVTHFCY